MGTAHLAKRFGLIPNGLFILGLFLAGLILSLACVMGPVKPAGAFDASRIVRLPDSTAINLGPHASLVENAVDGGGLSALAAGYLSRGQSADAAAVLVYAVRYRPGRTPEIAQAAVRLTEKYQDPAWAGLVFKALAAEPAMLPETLAEALEQGALPPLLAETAYFSAGLPPVADSNAAGSNAAGSDAAVQQSDVAAETSSPDPHALSAGEVFGGSLLPESLRIGGGNGGLNSAEPSDDGGAS